MVADSADTAYSRFVVDPRRRRWLTDKRIPNIDGPVTVLFAPDAQFRAHFHYVALLARTLADLGHNTLLIRCFEVFEVCPPCYPQIVLSGDQGAIGAPPCQSCGKVAYNLSRKYGVMSASIAAFLDEREIDSVRRQVDAHDFSPERLRKLEDQVESLAFIDFPLLFKALDFDISTGQRAKVFRNQIATVLLMKRAVDSILARFDVRQTVIYGGYSIQSTIRVVSEKASVPCIQIANASHKSIDWQRLTMLREDWSSHSFSRIDEWQAWKSLALTKSQIEEFSNDLLEIRLTAGAQTIFSPGRESSGPLTLETLGLDETRQTIVCFTSSPDERDSAEAMFRAFGRKWKVPNDCYEDQIAWIKDLAEAVEQSDDLQLVVRIHPREGRVKSGYLSDHYHLLQSAFGNADYRHCRFIWPEDSVSSYGLAELADIIAVAWTSMGHEMARMGMPVVSPFERYIRVPRNTFVRFLSSRETMLREIVEELIAAPSISRVVTAYRWCNFTALGYTVDLSDVIPRADKAGLKNYRLPKAAELMERVVIKDEHLEHINRQSLEKTQSDESAASELAAIAAQLRRFLVFLVTGEKDAELCQFRLLGADKAGNSHPGANSDGRTICLIANDGRRWTKFSPMAVRQLSLIAAIEERLGSGGD